MMFVIGFCCGYVLCTVLTFFVFLHGRTRQAYLKRQIKELKKLTGLKT